jgi:hypothetical protein
MSWRALLSFLLLGAVLLVAKRGASQWLEPRPLLSVSVAADARDVDVQAAIDDALLVDLSLREGWAETDPVVRDRLLRNMRFVHTAALQDDAMVARALSLGMHLSDPVARQRLAGRARQRLEQPTPADEPSEAELRAYLEANAKRYASSPRVRFVHVFLSRQQHGSDLDRAAEALAVRLRRDGPSPEEARAWSDPTLLAYRQGPLTAERIDASFGPGFGEAVMSAELERWYGPLRSTFGLHFVRLRELQRGARPSLAQLRARLRHDLLVDGREARVRAALARYRGDYRIEVERTP